MILHAAVRALLESLSSIEGQQARLDDELDELAKPNEIAWRLMSVPGGVVRWRRVDLKRVIAERFGVGSTSATSESFPRSSASRT
jgi:hypothetical protein